MACMGAVTARLQPPFWVGEMKPTHMAKFVREGKVKSEQSPGVCEFLVDDYEFSVEDSANTTDMIRFCRTMIAERSTVSFHIRLISTNGGRS